MVYKRDKHGVQLSGDPKDIKWAIWFDLISSRFLGLVVFIILLIGVPNISFVPAVWQWIKKQFPFMTLFGVAAGHWLLMLLSG